MKNIHKIKYGDSKDLPKEIREEFGLDDKGLYKEITGEEAHIVEGVKTNLEDAGFDIINEQVHLKRNGKIYVHQKGEKVYYIEDIKNILKLLSN